MIQPIFVNYKRYCHRQYIWYIHLIRYLIHQYLLMGQQVTLNHHHTTYLQKALHLKEKLLHAIIQPIRYQTCQLTRIHIQVHQILLCRIYLTHQTTSIMK